LVNDRIARHRDRVVAFTGENLHARKHFRLEQTGGIVDGRAHQEPPDRWIERRGDVGDVGREGAVGIGQHGEVDRLTDVHYRRFGLPDKGHHPDGGQITDDEDRIGRAAADILARPDLALHYRPGDRGRDQRGWIDRPFLLEV